MDAGAAASRLGAAAHGSGGATTTAVGASLLDLPEGVLRLLWRLLKPQYANDIRDQHALRCTCKGLKQTTDGFISSLAVNVCLTMPALRLPAGSMEQAADNQNKMAALCASACSQAMQQVARFPSSATARSLRLFCGPDHYASQPFEYHVLPDVLSTMLLQASPKLSAVQRVELSGRVVSMKRQAGHLHKPSSCNT